MKVFHKVAFDDTLQKISDEYNCTVEELVKVNDLVSEDLKNVEMLEIPKESSKIVVVKNNDREVLLEVKPENLQAIDDLIKNKIVVAQSGKGEWEVGDKILFKNQSGRQYVARPLDTLQKIANKFGVSVESIVVKNNLKTNKIFIGQKLII